MLTRRTEIERALAPWAAQNPEFFWLPTEDALLLDRATGAVGTEKNGAMVEVGGQINCVGGDSKHIEFVTRLGPDSYPTGISVVVLVDVIDPSSMTGAFIKIGGNTANGLGVGAGDTYFDNYGNKLLALIEGWAWRTGPANAFVKGLNAVYLSTTSGGALVDFGVANTGLSSSQSNGYAWNPTYNYITVNGYTTPRGTNAGVVAAAAWKNNGDMPEANAFVSARCDEVKHLWGDPDAGKLFVPIRRGYMRSMFPAVSGGLSLTGSLTGQGSTLSASATNTEVHAISGTLVGAGATLSGTATRIYSLTGALTGQGATLSGSATTLESHAATGALVGAGSTLSATATNTEIHAATGALVGAGSSVSGTATHTPLGINASGSLVGQGATLSATATNTEVHTCTGALYGQGATLSGALTRVFSASGSLVGAGSTLSATAGNAVAVFSATGSLVGQGSTLTGSATNTETHAVSGSLAGQGATLSATAALANLHTLSGSLVGSGSSLVGYASGPTTAFEASPDAIVTVINKRNRVSVISRRS